MFPNSEKIRALLLVSILAPASVTAFAAEVTYPNTPKEPVTDTYFDQKVTDDYRWLENANDPRVVQWTAAENKVARDWLDALPQRAGIKEELQAMLTTTQIRRGGFQFAGGHLFALKRQPPKNQPILVVLASPTDLKSERDVVDPNVIDGKGTTAIDWYRASPDGKFVAVSLSVKGSEDGTLHVYDVASGKALRDVIPRVQFPTGGGSLAWDGGSKGFLYTRYPAPGEHAEADMRLYQRVFHHTLGTAIAKDTYSLGDDFPPIAETGLAQSEDGRYALASVRNGDGGEVAFYVHDPAGKWIKVAGFTDKIHYADFGRDGRLYALSVAGSPHGRIVVLPLEHLSDGLVSAPTLVPESEGVITGFTASAHRLYVEVLAGGPSELRMVDLEGKSLGTVGAEEIADVGVGARLAGDSIIFGSGSYLRPFSWFAYDPAVEGGRLVPLALSEPPRYSMSNVEVIRDFATSVDGTRVPVNIIRHKGIKLDGSNPVLLTGYGGYGASLSPSFNPGMVFWLNHGGVYVEVNLRGGGEYGEEWHLNGNLTKKQHVFDDFISAADYLFDKHYTTPARLAIQGGSNGGLLMGAVTVQHPNMFHAVVSQVGIYDMLRVELTPNGIYNVTEFGTVKNQDQFKALYAYSPLHHVQDGVAYPAMLLTTGEHDGRVDPYMSKKMTARLQAASISGQPILLRVASDAGHGIGSSLASRVEENADIFAFLFRELGMK